VHDIWNKFVMMRRVNCEVRHLQMISIRFLNTKPKFTALNFFRLDWSFCHVVCFRKLDQICISPQLFYFLVDWSFHHVYHHTSPVQNLAANLLGI
jgi:hypothetical protein